MGCQEIRDVHREAGARSGAGPRLTPQRGPWGSRFCRCGTGAQRSGTPSKLGEPRILERRQRPMPSLDSEREYCFEFQPRPPQADRYPHGPRHRRWLGRARAPGEIELRSRLLQPGCANPFPFSIFVIPDANSVSIAISIDRSATGAAASSPPLFLAFPSVLRRPAGKEAALDHFVASVAQAGDDRDDVLRGVAGE